MSLSYKSPKKNTGLNRFFSVMQFSIVPLARISTHLEVYNLLLRQLQPRPMGRRFMMTLSNQLIEGLSTSYIM